MRAPAALPDPRRSAVVVMGKEPILDGDEAVGYVTSANYGSPSARASPTATCRSSRRAGHEVEVESSASARGDGRGEPLFDPRNARLRDVAPAAVAG